MDGGEWLLLGCHFIMIVIIIIIVIIISISIIDDDDVGSQGFMLDGIGWDAMECKMNGVIFLAGERKLIWLYDSFYLTLSLTNPFLNGTQRSVSFFKKSVQSRKVP